MCMYDEDDGHHSSVRWLSPEMLNNVGIHTSTAVHIVDIIQQHDALLLQRRTRYYYVTRHDVTGTNCRQYRQQYTSNYECTGVIRT